MSDKSVAAVRASVCATLEPRRAELEQAILAEIWAVSSRVGAGDEEYAQALQTAVSAGVGHGLAGVERGADEVGPVPAALLAEARHAARSGIGLEVELRRYFAGYTLFCDFVMEAAEADAPPSGSQLRRLLQTLALIFDRFVMAAVEEYRRERGESGLPPSGLRLERVKMLLGGQSVAADELAYELNDWHVGAIGRGDGMEAALREAAEVIDRRILLVQPDSEVIWAWLAGRNRIAVAEIAARLSTVAPPGGVVALGEPARGVEGWRLTHQQAKAAFAIARRGVGAVVRYADVGLVASISGDRLVASSLRQLYLAPLAAGRDGGVAIRDTLRAYFKAGRNVSSAASALGISRQTVGNRLRAVEEGLGRTLESCAPELELALRLDELEGH